MKKRSDKFYLSDILDCIKKIEKYTMELSFKEFCKKQIVIDAVVRNFEIIGEAARNVSNKIKSVHKEIPWKEMVGMRNKIIHEYFGVDLKICWKTIRDSLPDLKNKISHLIKNNK